MKGYTRLLAGASAEGYAYARISPGDNTSSGTDKDGGFVDWEGKTIPYTNVSTATPQYRYWKVSGGGMGMSMRHGRRC